MTTPEKQITFTIRQMIVVIATVISLTFSGTLIWARFQIMETEIKENRDQIDYVNERIDRKFKQLQKK